ncbi:MAG: 50S ribosomal protein L13 [Candidatus Cardinium sp.]|uniref:50S ribosomal protein L13 n=1 Tax=Candidatus Cardinium sp. TP TaxID=2961955 RepID=UPI0021AFF275|nr:50S ribosomal protein L13 [Candidatus Cardinium sp. TP]MCT4696820.1 50S ribosomal protein L13 [Candidatus Cardinium sp. TP]MDN5246828.1 50S ribosomal protein L13 [Candidatus Cardinium sp.]
MDYISYKTKYANKQSINKQWVVVDASFQPLGRLASQLAYLIRGKHKPDFTPHVDGGDHVIVLNADKIAVSGNKSVKKIYTTYSGYPGGLKRATFQEVHVAHPKRVVEHAVKGMLPKNRLGRRLLHNLHVCEGSVHPYAAQKPTSITLKY